jgi:hypothetical protein
MVGRFVVAMSTPSPAHARLAVVQRRNADEIKNVFWQENLRRMREGFRATKTYLATLPLLPLSFKYQLRFQLNPKT